MHLMTLDATLRKKKAVTKTNNTKNSNVIPIHGNSTLNSQDPSLF
jgi:hypothetical protein